MDELTGPLEEVFKDLKEKWKEFQEEPPFSDVVMGFVSAVDWKETWIQALMATQVVVMLLALFTRKSVVLQSVLFFVAAATIYMAERLNALGDAHWEKFSKQAYFDKRGVFFSTLVSGPLILAMLVLLINYLVTCSVMLVKAKRQELKYKGQQRVKVEKAADAGTGAGTGAGTSGGDAGGTKTTGPKKAGSKKTK
ncbi:hypothetical protein FOA52_000142 [Chlamydomonas sp. UWO 241]|nr:hypothetical protein FOA52_000142 [Chlamydomonas sp. UWO 241]